MLCVCKCFFFSYDLLADLCNFIYAMHAYFLVYIFHWFTDSLRGKFLITIFVLVHCVKFMIDEKPQPFRSFEPITQKNHRLQTEFMFYKKNRKWPFSVNYNSLSQAIIIDWVSHTNRKHIDYKLFARAKNKSSIIHITLWMILLLACLPFNQFFMRSVNKKTVIIDFFVR